MKRDPIDVTQLLGSLELMIIIVDRLSENQPIPDSIRKLVDKAESLAIKTRKALEPP